MWKLFEAPEEIDGENPLDIDRLAFLVCRGERLTGVGDYAYRRPDGVYIVPAGCLKD